MVLRAGQRRAARWVVAVGLLVAGVTAPAESRDWFGPLESLAPADLAWAAAGTVEAGTPIVCSTLTPDPADTTTVWTVVSGAGAEDRECVLTADAVCPPDHVKPTTDGTPPFLCHLQTCSGTDLDIDDIGNYWVPTSDSDTSGANDCDLFKLTECRVGIGPTHDGLCRYVQRRSWTCRVGYEQHNRFNTCYRAYSAPPPGPLAPCNVGTGAPELSLLSCEDYAGGDYDSTEDCPDISSHLTVRPGGAAAAYWCQFDASQLSVDCRRAVIPDDADCDASVGVCLKRRSTSQGQRLRALGGCYAIVRSIDCTGRQAGYADQVAAGTDSPTLAALAQTIRTAGCEPCRVVPYQPLDTSECPDHARRVEPTVDLSRISNTQEAALEAKRDVSIGLQGVTSGCQELPPGRLTWSTPGLTDLVLVNTRVRLDMDWNFTNITRVPYKSGQRGFGECFLMSQGGQVRLYMKVAVEPLWPEGDPDDPTDSGDRSLMESLFGSDSLAWWDALSAEEKTRLTEAFYIAPETRAVEVPCTIEIPIWCIWTPKHAGYYELTAIGALRIHILYGMYKNSGYSGTVDTDWYSQYSQLTRSQIGQCRVATPGSNCLFGVGYSREVGLYIENEPIGIRVNEVRSVSRPYSRP